jgi:hypothetical protein
MSGTMITNRSVEPVTLPFPLSGVLAPGKSAVVSVDKATLRSLVTLEPGLKLTTMPAAFAGPYDTAYEGAAGASGSLSIPGSIAISGSILPVREQMGVWVRDNVAAGLTDSVLSLNATAAVQLERAAIRAGSVTGIGMTLTVAPAGANLVAKVFKNGTLLNAACILTVVPGAPLGYSVSFAKGLYTFAAGDRLGVAITTPGGWTATTSDIAVSLEIES